jgi:8-oxo-dGTP diphosphatase
MVTFTKKHIGCEEALDLPPPACAQKPVKLVVAAALVDGDGRVLIAQRPPGKTLAGLWEFPGGKLDAGETPEFALMRELREELDIETRPCCFTPAGFASHSYDDFHLLMPLFICRVWRGAPKPLEGQGLAWVFPQKLYDYEMPPADIPLIPQLIEQL